ncbi:hypothetical protein P9314_02425 [Paenibacillus validus]|uniref:DNA alkylation repair protein n=1 Tax=Paenibacillus validus TaxID=44253 RepID=A0A7X2Z8Z1_9BACL|nr:MULTISPECIES: hypothetical protein [Paenibacillus]MED4599560.1 hypothetical protein [Paenibacillus validus]MED4607094.1 hypothetical protein [Paenibacillus validus]MUG70545.1 hypothetical protein [Paenibacillus validus]
MQEKPYFCPNCRSNRIKFSIISSYSQRFLKDAITGTVQQVTEPEAIEGQEPTIQCLVCQFTGNELRFIKQAEREPRESTSINTIY